MQNSNFLRVALLLTATTFLTSPAYAASADNSVAAIAAFLKAPTTHVFPDDGLEWQWKEEHLTAGEVLPNGGCKFGSVNHAPITSTQNLVTEEIAVDRSTCISLTREGSPTDNSWSLLQAVLQKVTKIGSAQSPAKRSAAVTNSTEPAADAQDTYSYSLTFTDGNQSLIKLLNLFSFTAASVPISINYSYTKEVPVTNGCASLVNQISQTANSPSAGFAGWTTTSGGSCQVWNQNANGLELWETWDYDKSGTQIDYGVDGSDDCTARIPQHFECNAVIDQWNYWTTTLGSVANGSFSNSTYFPPFFDCRNGVTISVPYALAYMYPRSVFYDDRSYSISGTDGPTFKCVSNLKVVETRSANIGQPGP